MNNARISKPENESSQPLEERTAFLVRMIEAIEEVSKFSYWKIIEMEMFSGVVESLERRIRAEVDSPEINTKELYRLQGQLAWARKYADIRSLQEVFKVELSNIKKRNNAN